jgi:hypothetical protein
MKIDKPIVLTEYPKSGGSWITSLIGDAFAIPKRDIYIRPGFDLFDISNHPWYKGGELFDFPTRSVIKSHELPESQAIDFDATYLHVVRDGRDVIVSRWFFDKDFMVKNGIVSSFDVDFDSYLEEKATEWAAYVNAWLDRKVVTVKYEDFLSAPEASLSATIKAVTGVDLPRSDIASAVAQHTKEKFAASLGKTFKHNTFVRKGVAGDWKNHFSAFHSERFAAIAGDAMRRLGYPL